MFRGIKEREAATGCGDRLVSVINVPFCRSPRFVPPPPLRRSNGPENAGARFSDSPPSHILPIAFKQTCLAVTNVHLKGLVVVRRSLMVWAASRWCDGGADSVPATAGIFKAFSLPLRCAWKNRAVRLKLTGLPAVPVSLSEPVMSISSCTKWCSVPLRR